jgi:branched-chain amino acid transport system substrate-binding protein
VARAGLGERAPPDGVRVGHSALAPRAGPSTACIAPAPEGDLLLDYTRRFGKAPAGFDLYAVEAGRVAIDGIRRAGDELGRVSTLVERREAVRKAIAATRGFDGHNGRWSFDRNGDVDYEVEELDRTISGFRVVKADGPIGCAFQFDTLLGR